MQPMNASTNGGNASRGIEKNGNTNSTKIIAAAFPEAGRLAPIRGSVLCRVFYQINRLRSKFEAM